MMDTQELIDRITVLARCADDVRRRNLSSKYPEDDDEVTAAYHGGRADAFEEVIGMLKEEK